MKKTAPTIVMDEPLWTELRVQALREKTTASDIIGRVVAQYLKKGQE